jgi:hypothetical protein
MGVLKPFSQMFARSILVIDKLKQWFLVSLNTTRYHVIYDEIVMMKSEIVTDHRIAHLVSNWARFL